MAQMNASGLPVFRMWFKCGASVVQSAVEAWFKCGSSVVHAWAARGNAPREILRGGPSLVRVLFKCGSSVVQILLKSGYTADA
eukprot:5531041-Pyramimonas_sp.AAC.1